MQKKQKLSIEKCLYILNPVVDSIEYTRVTPELAGWELLHFAARRMSSGEIWEFETGDHEYGIVMLSDIAKYVLATDRAPERVNVYEVMSKPVICIRPDMDIRYCARLFDKFGLSRAPVVEKGKVIGIVSFTDMVLIGMVQND